MKTFGLIGYPLGHSFSKDYFTKKFLDENIKNCSYQNFEIESLDDFKSLINLQTNLSGLNVTIPFKEKIINNLDQVDDIAKENHEVSSQVFERVSSETDIDNMMAYLKGEYEES